MMRVSSAHNRREEGIRCGIPCLISVCGLLILVLFAFPENVTGQEESQPDSLVSVSLRHGSIIQGRIIQKDSLSITVLTEDSVRIDLPRSAIQSIAYLSAVASAGDFRRKDPNYSRLLFAPTGRPLQGGDGYFSDHYVFFPGITYGLTNNLSIMGGLSILPGVNFADQMKYFAPKFGKQFSEKQAYSVGALYLSFLGEGAGIAFATGTYGMRSRSFTGGVGFGYTRRDGEEFRFSKYPVLLFGGNIRLSENIALVSENWLITGNEGTQIFSGAVRFFGERLAADVGLLLVPEILEQGFPVPWLSFVYNFGN